ncbi:hypothetical protein JOD54_002174 [Actinokineospora baliensis]|uniref:VG15 protein n=1 Tax=Actinokineospora baliensis TaxID=547056 RepID=UPI00195C609F|nr:hypothetical protein [Actinokineospora baliensis]MBM7771970.1 hypothetical protein [Actinokineospora baliensis]
MTAPAPGLTYSQYVLRQAAIVSALARILVVLLAPYRVLRLGPGLWQSLLTAVFPHVDRARTLSASLAREFYDAERLRQLADGATQQRDNEHQAVPAGRDDPPRSRHPVDLPGYDPRWLAESLEPHRAALSLPNASATALAQVVSIAAKHAEDAGRKTTLRGIKDDKEAVGWARVAGGGESCAFCTMLISRGPVYLYASTAGLDTDDFTAGQAAKKLVKSGDSTLVDELMTRWHPHCDCKVVPVFRLSAWSGRDAYLEAQSLWETATKGLRGKDALNALRRALYAGERDEDVPVPLRPAA